MSKRNGDRARFQKDRKRKIAKRMRMREAAKAGAEKKASK